MPGAVAGWTQTYANDFTSPSLGDFQVYNGPAPELGACWSSAHTAVTGGELQLLGFSDPTAATSLGCSGTNYEYVTGGLKLTANSQTYGMYEVRARIDSGQGVSAALQLWPTDNDWNNGIVFMEDNGEPTRSSSLATEYSSNTSTIDRQTLSLDATQWHTYGVMWTPGSIEYTIDGTVWGSITSPDVPDIPMQLAIQTESWQCGANNWELCIAPTSPANINMDVDWVVAYSQSSTTGTDGSGSTTGTSGSTTGTSGSGTGSSSTGSSSTKGSTKKPERTKARIALKVSERPDAITLGTTVVGVLARNHTRRGFLTWKHYSAGVAAGSGTAWRRAGSRQKASISGVATITASRVRNKTFTRLIVTIRGANGKLQTSHWKLISQGKRTRWAEQGA